MKFLFFKSKKEVLPSLSALRPPLFNVERFWIICLLIFLLSIASSLLIGFILFYNESNEDYKQGVAEGNSASLINKQRLKSLIDKRNEFVNRETPILRDPSIELEN